MSCDCYATGHVLPVDPQCRSTGRSAAANIADMSTFCMHHHSPLNYSHPPPPAVTLPSHQPHRYPCPVHQQRYQFADHHHSPVSMLCTSHPHYYHTPPHPHPHYCHTPPHPHTSPNVTTPVHAHPSQLSGYVQPPQTTTELATPPNMTTPIHAHSSGLSGYVQPLQTTTELATPPTTEVATHCNMTPVRGHSSGPSGCVQPPQTTTELATPPNTKRKLVVMKEWYIRISTRGAVLLEGSKIEDAPGTIWHSGRVTQRLTSHEVATKSGTVYHLQGEACLNKFYSLLGALDQSVVQKFKHGFPPDWSSLVQNIHYRSCTALPGSSAKEDVKTCVKESVTTSAMESVTTSTMESEKTSRKESEKTSRKESEKTSGKESVTTSAIESVKEIVKTSSKTSVKEDVNVIVKESVKTSINKNVKLEPVDTDQPSSRDSSSFLSSLKRSSRGRMLKPAVNVLSPGGFSSELYQYDMLGSFTGLSAPVIDLTGDNSTFALVEGVKKEQHDGVESEQAVTQQEPLAKREKDLQTTPKGGLKSQVKSTPRASVSRRGKKRSRVTVPSLVRKKATTAVMEESAGERSQEEEGSSLNSEQESDSRFKSVRESSSQPTSSTAWRRGRSGREKKAPKDAGVAARTRAGAMKQTQHIPHTLVDTDCGYSDDSVHTKKKSKRAQLIDSSDGECVQILQKESESRPTRPNEVKRRLGASPCHAPELLDPATSTEAKNRKRRRRAHVIVPSLAKKKAETAAMESAGEWSLEEEGGSTLNWDQDSIRRLKSIVYNTPAMTAGFWKVVAKRLGTGHTARDCSTQYSSSTAPKPQRRNTGRAKEKITKEEGKKDSTVSARAGTLKRKQQIRGALEKMDRGYSDDLFDSTPFKKKFKRVQLLESSDDEYLQKESESRPITTPKEVKRRLGAPPCHTPKLSDYATSTDAKTRHTAYSTAQVKYQQKVVDARNVSLSLGGRMGTSKSSADTVMFRVQKAKKSTKQRPKQKAQKATKATVKAMNSGSLLRNIRTGEITNYHVFEDSSDDSSDVNPFSDIEDAYSDIITRLY